MTASHTMIEPRAHMRTLPRDDATASMPRRAKSQSALDRIGLDIVSGVRLPGARLPSEADLARALGISRPSLREALRALAAKGLVDARTRRGTVVRDKTNWNVLDADVLRWYAAAPPDPAFLIDLLDTRVIFEPAAARLAASRASPEQILAIEGAFRAMAAALPADVDACCYHDLAFHELIIGATGNRILIRFAVAIRTALLAAFRVSSNARASYENSLAEHWAVAVSIRRRDPDAAERAMRQLLTGTARDLAPVYEASHPRVKTRPRAIAAASRPRKRRLQRD